MSIERQRRLVALWSWLPAYRAVAEAEHLPTASRTLAVSPSALSRTIRLLEQELGHPMFDRVGRNLRLNHHGQLLLGAVRTAMRQLDDAVEAIVTQEPRGPIRIAATTAMLQFLLEPAMTQLRAKYPDVEPWIFPPGPSEGVNADLLGGRLDLALLQHPLPSPDLQIDKLFDLNYAIYCAAGHPLYRRTDISQADLRAHEFVGPTITESNSFPPALRPRITLRVYQMSVAMDFCASGHYLAVLPDRVVASRADLDLWALPGIALSPGALFMVSRDAISTPNPTVEALSDIMRQLTS